MKNFYPSWTNKYLHSFILYLLSGVIGVYVLFATTVSSFQSDFFAFYTAATLVKTNSSNLYNPSVQLSEQESLLKVYSPQTHRLPVLLPFVNPLPVALFFVPYTVFPLPVAYRVAQIFSLFCVIILIFLARKLFHVPYQAMYFLGTMSFAPVYIAVFQTQTAIFSLVVFLGLYWCLINNKDVLAGIIMSLLIVKPQFLVPVLVFYLTRKKWQTLVVFSICMLGILSTWLFVFPTHLYGYPAMLNWYVENVEKIPYESDKMISLQGLIFQIFGLVQSVPSYEVSLFVSGLVLGSIALYWHLVQRDTKELFLMLPPVMLLTSGHVQTHEAVLLLITVLALLRAKEKNFGKVVSIGWGVFLITYFTPFYPKPMPFLATVYMLFLLWFLIANKKIYKP